MITFSEEQRFKQKWLWLLLIVSTVLPLIIVLIQVFKGNADLLVVVIVLIITILMLMLFRSFCLYTTIDEEGISYQLFPFHLRPVKKAWSDIEKAYVRKYKPMREYGGWGLKYTFRNGTAVNISGDMGLQLVLKGGKKLLLGTQQPDAIDQVLLQLSQSNIISSNVLAPEN